MPSDPKGGLPSDAHLPCEAAFITGKCHLKFCDSPQFMGFNMDTRHV